MSVIEHQGGAITGRLLRARRVVRITRPLKPSQAPPALSQPQPQPQADTIAEANMGGESAGAVTGRLAVVGVANRLLVTAVGLGSCVDLLFYRKATGISMLVFVGLMLGALFWAARSGSEGVRPAWRNMWLVAPLFFFAAMVAVRESETLTLLNIAASMALLCMVISFFVGGQVEKLGLLGYPLAVARTVKEMLSRPTPMASAMRWSATANHNFNRRAFEIARGVFLAIPVVILFTFLLSSADSVFQGYVGDALKLRFLSNAPEITLQIAIVFSASWLAAGALLIVSSKSNKAAVNANGSATGRLLLKGRGLGFMEASIVLGLVNTLFAAFAWIQFAVLFSGEAARTMGFEEYREYVRRGFGELLAVAILTMILILGLRRAMRRTTEGQERTLKILNSVMIVLALVMLVSAFERMVVWESIQFYINTATRIFVRTFIVWLALLFVWLLFTSWFRRDRFAFGAFVVALGFLVTMNLINPDASVAAYNVGRDDELSVCYLDLLSDDAVPALAAGLDTTTGDTRLILGSNLIERLKAMEQDTSWQDWPAFNFSRQQAYETLVKLRNEHRIPYNRSTSCWYCT
jgi:hypothetical protein